MKRYQEFINEQVNWSKLLINFAYSNNLKGVKQALDNGANIHYENDTALRYAIHNGHLEVIKYLIEQGANIHSNNYAILYWANKMGHLDVVNYLCELIIKNEPQYIPKIIQYIPEELKEKYAHLLAASDMDLL